MAMILDAFMSKFSELLMQMVQDKVGILLGIPGEIEKLEQTMGDIQCVIADAERRQTESLAMKRWLMELKDVMYDADDIMDLCQIKAQERLDHCDSPSSSKIGRYFLHLLSCFRNPAFAHEIGTKIKEINSRLVDIAKRRYDLGLIAIQTVVEPPPVRKVIEWGRGFVGEKMEEDAELVLNWLTEQENGVRGNIGVVAVVGMGGIGKTFLAKRIFNDSKIDEEFDLKFWACVSKEVNAVELLKGIIRHARGEHGVAEEKSELLFLLERVIKGKKFFLVLDDVWPESLAVWDVLLRDPMSGGAKGSRLLVTTRDERVADGMRAAKSHHVNKMLDEDGWSLLIEEVFENDGESEIKKFKNIGLELVKKCDGLPLAIKSIGAILCGKRRTIEAWQAVQESNVWNELPDRIHEAFNLSYEDLPPHLKECFIFCSLYPEDHEFDQTDLIYLWCAEEFLQDNENLWELGNEYYQELLSRNLLEKTRDQYYLTRSKMHHLLRSFAHNLGKDENFISKEGEAKLRRLSIENQEVNFQFKKDKSLRTLLINDIHQNAIVGQCTTLRSLRILYLRCPNITTLPDSLGVLIHLRYLRVQCRMITIPKSIGYLKNLICFDASECYKLQHVPSSILNLKQLRHLCLSGTNVDGIPSGLRNLEKLIQLCGFETSKNNLEVFSSLDELETLTHLITLQLTGLEKVTDKNIAKRVKLKQKYKLKALKLECTRFSQKDQLSQTNEKKAKTEDILNELCPPPSIEFLGISGYFGNYLPNWLNFGITLPNLRLLEIEHCNCFENLVALGQLPNLYFLKIRYAHSILSVGEELLWGDIKSSNSTSPAFPKLNTLYFERISNWKEWQWNKTESAMPKLKELFITYCPQLRSLPEGLSYHATFLEKLEIYGGDNLSTVKNLPFIKDIDFSNNTNLERISNLPRVSNILIRDCPNLKTVENLDALRRMRLVDSKMEVLPEYLMAVTPRMLRIDCSKELLRKITSQRERGSEWYKFKHIPKVSIYSRNYSLYATYYKEPFSFTTTSEHD